MHTMEQSEHTGTHTPVFFPLLRCFALLWCCEYFNRPRTVVYVEGKTSDEMRGVVVGNKVPDMRMLRS